MSGKSVGAFDSAQMMQSLVATGATASTTGRNRPSGPRARPRLSASVPACALGVGLRGRLVAYHGPGTCRLGRAGRAMVNFDNQS